MLLLHMLSTIKPKQPFVLLCCSPQYACWNLWLHSSLILTSIYVALFHPFSFCSIVTLCVFLYATSVDRTYLVIHHFLNLCLPIFFLLFIYKEFKSAHDIAPMDHDSEWFFIIIRVRTRDIRQISILFVGIGGFGKINLFLNSASGSMWYFPFLFIAPNPWLASISHSSMLLKSLQSLQVQ